MSVKIKLLGTASISHAGTWLEPPPGKTSALLYYLVYQNTWVSRDDLIYLFWPDTLEENARNNLRRLLSSIRDLDYAEGIEIEATRVRWLVDSDVKEFKQALAEPKLAKAVQLYQGEFLKGFKVSTSEFENWLELERQELHKSWKNAASSLASDFEDKAQYGQAAEVLAHLHKIELFDETVVRRYLDNLQQSQQEAKALEVFETFKKTLEQEFGSEPERETLELIQAIRQGDARTVTLTATKTSSSRANKPRHNLTVQPTAFVGREIEQRKLAALLSDLNCRLVTILAPGGMGKTRLAIEGARAQLEHFEHGVWFVSFVAVNAPEQMVYSIGDALGINFFGQREPKEQLFDYLAEKEMLLVLDNLEHLLSGIQLVRELLEAAPKIKILTTSRERLHLQAEHIFDLEGLAVPDEQSIDAGGFDSLQLFEERAKHSRHDFVLDDNTTPSAVQICRLVEGMPLAIELAASWLRVLSINDIAKEIEKGIGLLESSA